MEAHLSSPDMERLADDLAAVGPRNAARLKVAVRSFGRGTAADAEMLAPERTGRLKGSIHTVSRGNHVEVIADTDYADYVEHGTSRMAPQPYMRPATDRNLGKFQDDVLDIGGDVL